MVFWYYNIFKNRNIFREIMIWKWDTSKLISKITCQIANGRKCFECAAWPTKKGHKPKHWKQHKKKPINTKRNPHQAAKYTVFSLTLLPSTCIPITVYWTGGTSLSLYFKCRHIKFPTCMSELCGVYWKEKLLFCAKCIWKTSNKMYT